MNPRAHTDTPTTSRRDFVHASLLLAAGAALTGCAGSNRSASNQLPGVAWPTEPTPAPRPREPVATAPARPAPARPEPVVTTLPRGVVARTAWTRSGVARPSEAYPMAGIARITVHHDGMDPLWNSSETAVAQRLESIRRAHVAQGWADIGYHFAIDPAGRVWEARSVSLQGAHVKENNEHNLGILVLGNFDRQRPTPEAVASLDRFVAGQMTRYRVPISRVYTHREIRPTACPGTALQSHMVRTRSRGGSLALLAEQGVTLG